LLKANQILSSAFYVAWSEQGTKHLATVLFPETLTGIGKSAFGYTLRLQRIAMPDAVTYLGEYAFMYCRGLKEVRLSKNLIRSFLHRTGKRPGIVPDLPELGARAFGKCRGLTSIILPRSLTKIGYGAFEFCYGLREIYAYNPTPIDLSAH